MSEYREFTGKSVEEALKLAREAFGAELNDLDFEILTPGSRGVALGGRAAELRQRGGDDPGRFRAHAENTPAPGGQDLEVQVVELRPKRLARVAKGLLDRLAGELAIGTHVNVASLVGLACPAHGGGWSCWPM